ncbi:MAG: hypothetical protein LBF65_01085 [Holosporales bacterium]|jgi:hypothetical protein|nr:hypothetical protein [Holosporales bacterium]
MLSNEKLRNEIKQSFEVQATHSKKLFLLQDQDLANPNDTPTQKIIALLKDTRAAYNFATDTGARDLFIVPTLSSLVVDESCSPLVRVCDVIRRRLTLNDVIHRRLAVCEPVGLPGTKKSEKSKEIIISASKNYSPDHKLSFPHPITAIWHIIQQELLDEGHILNILMLTQRQLTQAAAFHNSNIKTRRNVPIGIYHSPWTTLHEFNATYWPYHDNLFMGYTLAASLKSPGKQARKISKDVARFTQYRTGPQEIILLVTGNSESGHEIASRISLDRETAKNKIPITIITTDPEELPKLDEEILWRQQQLNSSNIIRLPNGWIDVTDQSHPFRRLILHKNVPSAFIPPMDEAIEIAEASTSK